MRLLEMSPLESDSDVNVSVWLQQLDLDKIDLHLYRDRDQIWMELNSAVRDELFAEFWCE